MSVRFQIQMTPQTMYSFMLHHNYTHLAGILGVIFGMVVFVMGLGQIEAGNISSAALLFALAAAAVAYPPIMLWVRARRQVARAAIFQKPLSYELSGDGVKVLQGEKENINPWSDFQGAVSTGQALVLYMDKTHAVIFPRTQIGEKWTAAVQMISTHMPPDKVRIRQVN